ncbi:von Willebrand factor type A domain [Mactra antiquata]
MRYFSYKDTGTFLPVLQDIADSYNHTYHRTIGHIRSEKPTKVGDREVFHVEFNLLPNRDVSRERVIIITGARPWPYLKCFDFVLAKVQLKRTPRTTYFAPGRVVALPLHSHDGLRFYSIRLYNDQLINKRRSKIIKIGPDRFKDMLKHIKFRPPRKIVYPDRKPVPPYPPPFPPLTPSPRTGTPDKVPSVSSYGPVSATSSTVTTSSRQTSTTIRSSLGKAIPSRIPIDTVVLARWLDDGWFYYGRVVTQPDDDDDDSYTVVDASKHREIIKHEDLLRDAVKIFDAIQPGDHVIALHPKYIYSYAPGVVAEVYELGALVHFYDHTMQKLPWSEVYKITYNKYDEYVKYIDERMRTICGDVIARDDDTGFYKEYVADSAEVNAQMINLKIADDKFKSQKAIHVFPVIRPTKYNDLSWEYVLAPTDTTCETYLPARVTSQEPFRITLCDGTEMVNVDRSKCYYINGQYYKNAINYWTKKYQQKIPEPVQY